MDIDTLEAASKTGRKMRSSDRRVNADSQIDELGKETTAFLESQGFVVVKAVVHKGDASTCSVEVDGDLKQYAHAAQELGIRALFVTFPTLDDEDFYSDYEYGGGEETDLRDIEPALRKYEAHIGSCWSAEVTGFYGTTLLIHTTFAEWWDKFSILREQTIEGLADSAEEAQEERRRESELKQKEVLASIRALCKDDAFRSFIAGRRPTQRAIISYIRENIEDARLVSPGVLRDEATALLDGHLVRNRS